MVVDVRWISRGLVLFSPITFLFNLHHKQKRSKASWSRNLMKRVDTKFSFTRQKKLNSTTFVLCFLFIPWSFSKEITRVHNSKECN